MMPSKSTPNIQQQLQSQPQQQQQQYHQLQLQPQPSKNHSPSIYTYLQNQSGLKFAPSASTGQRTRDDDSPPPSPPVRDSSTLKSINYGPGHEKYPSWPIPAAADTSPGLKGPPSGGSHRSKSWTDHTNYPKEKVVMYTRPYMKKQYSLQTQQVQLLFLCNYINFAVNWLKLRRKIVLEYMYKQFYFTSCHFVDTTLCNGKS